MAIPGLKAKYEVRGKVRIGEKKVSQKGNSFPSSVDYFISADPEVVGRQQGDDPLRTLRVIFPYAEVEDNFSTGLEWWVQNRGKASTLACYTKGDGIALRKAQMVNEGDVLRGAVRGQDRQPITCAFRECPIFKRGDCKPMGRLIFFLEGGRTDQVLQIDTKSWNSIEQLTGALSGARLRGPLHGRVFELSVAFHTRGADRFPVLSIQEVDVEINSPADVEKAEALLAVERALAAGAAPNVALAAGLDVEKPDWRENEALVNRIKEIGVDVALANFKGRLS